MRNRGYIKLEMLERQCWSYLRNIKTAINYFYKRFKHNLPTVLIGKNLAEQWDLPNTGIFFSKDVASVKHYSKGIPVWTATHIEYIPPDPTSSEDVKVAVSWIFSISSVANLQ
jgi:hypothetical protein